MSTYRHAGKSRPSSSIAIDIIDGRPWTARRINHNNLRQHCHQLARAFRGSHPLTDPLRAPYRKLLTAIIEKSNLLKESHPAKFPVVPVLMRIAAYSNRWIRDPETWQISADRSPRGLIRSLIEHLFARWAVPEFCDSAWRVKGELQWLERNWYCDIADGASWRCLRGMPPTITSRALHHAMSAPEHLSVRQALRLGQIRALAGSDELLVAVLSSRMVKDLSNDAIWSRLFEKVVAANDFDPADFGVIADALLVLLSTGDFNQVARLVDQPLGDLLRHCRNYWRNAFRTGTVNFADWKGRDIRCENLRAEMIHRTSAQWTSLTNFKTYRAKRFGVRGLTDWRVEELTNQWQLTAESREMRHCVRVYGRKCREERSSIFSLRTDVETDGEKSSKSHLTVEVDRTTRAIVQIRSKWNGHFQSGQLSILREWADATDLKLGSAPP